MLVLVGNGKKRDRISIIVWGRFPEIVMVSLLLAENLVSHEPIRIYLVAKNMVLRLEKSGFTLTPRFIGCENLLNSLLSLNLDIIIIY